MKIHIHPETPTDIDLNARGDCDFVTLEAFCFSYVRESRGQQTEVVVPIGFESDLGSIPRLFRALISVASAPLAFVVHDWLYRRTELGRAECDAVMLALMHHADQPRSKWQRYLAFAGLRVGGWAGRIKAKAKSSK